ncbi:PREDICTED: uncharacterized protein C1orf228-like [Amphimedon queenslandica]|uniref:Uncharacterized protein n=1 Tax=Amphimedon queenslandica TaxID=400682 RepID=A0AAN0IGZ5_AMPQE|nr:PREDICTED: uncharacterized protein C1orf228-like [Amphimedon queenslandica]|eukprot:XP_003388802.1 PREDICTED: uncharacterized protein C1orf228-like [Amphimedon queenslandica]
MAPGSFQEIRHILSCWDKGTVQEREAMLEEFLNTCSDMTQPQLEAHFNDCSSLFLARLTAWLRITYMFGTCVGIQLQCIGVFINIGASYLTEFLEVGGILTSLEIVNLKSCEEADKSEALRLLTQISKKGRHFKEMICESYGIKVAAECLGRSQLSETQECAQHLLHELSMANPRYQTQVYKALIALLASSSSEAQRLSAYTLRLIQPSIGVVSGSIVDPLLMLLRSLHLDIQREAGLLINDLLEDEEIQQPLLMGLVNLLKVEDVTSKGGGAGRSIVTAQVQQESSAKIIKEIIERHPHLAQKLVEVNVVHQLLYALSNTGYSNSQRQSCAALQALMNELISVRELVQVMIGDTLFEKIIKSSPDAIPEVLSLDDVDILLASRNFKE